MKWRLEWAFLVKNSLNGFNYFLTILEEHNIEISNCLVGMESTGHTALGEPQRIVAYNTCQVAKYDNYELGSFSEEAKHAWRDTHWKEDLQKAFDAGKCMVEKNNNANY